MKRIIPQAALLLAVLSMLAALTGCKTVANGPHAQVAPTAPDYAAFAAAHNERIAMLSTLYSRGVLEIRWRDEAGVRRSEPQVDLDLYLMPARRTAFRASKVGEIYLWLGSDDEQFWIFDMTGDQRTLFHASHQVKLDHQGEPVTLHPVLIREMMGLIALPQPTSPDAPAVEYDVDRDAWAVTAPSTMPGWRIRLYFDRSSGLPNRAEALTNDDRVLMRSDIRRYRRATQEGMASMRFPWMPTLIDVTAEDIAEGVSRVDIKVSLASPTGRVSDQPMDRVFDLERLKSALRPERIETP